MGVGIEAVLFLNLLGNRKKASLENFHLSGASILTFCVLATPDLNYAKYLA